MTLALIGHLYDKPSNLLFLMPSMVKQLAEDVRKGDFIKAGRFFKAQHVLPVRGYTVDMEEILFPTEPPSPPSSLPPPSLPRHSPMTHSSVARSSGPHIPGSFRGRSVEGVTDVRKAGYGNFRGVLRRGKIQVQT